MSPGIGDVTEMTPETLSGSGGGGGGGNAKVERLEEFTRYLNRNVLQGRIIFKLKHDEREIAFLDTTVRLINGLFSYGNLLEPDAHQYLHASTSHPKHTVKSIPYSEGLRSRFNCSEGCKETNTLLTI